MITIRGTTRLAARTAITRFPLEMQWFSGLILLALLMASGPVRAAEPDEQYLQIYSLIDQADSLSNTGQTGPAKAKYQEAQTALLYLKKGNPSWNVKVVAYRLNYLAERIAALSQPVPTRATNAAPTNAQESNPETSAASRASGTNVKLLEAGAEPRKMLRFHVQPGDKQSVVMTMKMATETGVGATPGVATKIPAIKFPMTVTVKNVADNGDINYETVIAEPSIAADPDAMPAVADAMKAALGSMKGLASAGVMSSRGRNQTAETKGLSGADLQARRLMDQMNLSNLSSPLPDEAVGPGAKWEITLPVKSQGMTINQTETCELASIEGDRLNVKSTIVQRAANQTIENPALPGMKVQLTKMTGNGTGNTTLDLGKLLPSEATVDIHSEVSMGMNMGQQKQTITIKTDTNIRLEAQ